MSDAGYTADQIQILEGLKNKSGTRLASCAETSTHPNTSPSFSD